MGGAHSRTKGHSFERSVAVMLRAIYPDAKRGYQARGGTGAAPDVDGTPYYIECKRYAKRVDVHAAMKQAQEGTDGRDPLVIYKVDRGATYVATPSGPLLPMTAWYKWDGLSHFLFSEWLETEATRIQNAK